MKACRVLLFLLTLTYPYNDNNNNNNNNLAALLFATAQPSSFICNICGDDFIMTIPNGSVPLSPDTSFACSQLDEIAQGEGAIDEVQCEALHFLTQVPCGCVPPSDSMPPTVPILPSTAPSDAPSFGPPPDCFTDLDEVAARERAVRDVSSSSSSSSTTTTPRVIILCPDTEFVMGLQDADQDDVYNGGFAPIFPRPNAHYKCGTNGSSRNNCVLVNGDFPILSVGELDDVHDGIIFEGITIQASFRGGVVMAKPGHITFIDCIFRVSVIVVCCYCCYCCCSVITRVCSFCFLLFVVPVYNILVHCLFAFFSTTTTTTTRIMRTSV
jgi:hypothetical protein